MIWLWVLLGAAALLLLLGCLTAELCVRKVTRATRHDETFVRRQETEGGFGRPWTAMTGNGTAGPLLWRAAASPSPASMYETPPTADGPGGW